MLNSFSFPGRRASIIFAVCAALSLAACGGGNNASTDNKNSPTQSTAAFAVDVAIKKLMASGFSASAAASGQFTGLPVAGTASIDWYASTPSTFNNAPAVRVVVTESENLKVNGVDYSDVTRQYRFFDSSFKLLGQIDPDTGLYAEVTSFAGWPQAAKVGAKGDLASMTVYNNVRKTRIEGQAKITYALEADTASTAIFALTTVQSDKDGKPVESRIDRYRVSDKGDAVWVSTRVNDSSGATSSELTITATSTSAAKTMVTSVGPQFLPPESLWSAPVNAVPASGNYVYLQSETGDYIGAGKTYLYTDTNAEFNVSIIENGVMVSVDGSQWWSGNFAPMQSLSYLKAGYYANVTRFPFHDATKGGLSWGGDGRGCDTVKGWFVIDSVSYNGDQLDSLDLRFEQQCDGKPSALRGQIQWQAAN